MDGEITEIGSRMVQIFVQRMRVSHIPKVEGASLEACKTESSKDKFSGGVSFGAAMPVTL